METVTSIESRRQESVAVGVVGREVQELWFRLSGGSWNSLVLVGTPGCPSTLPVVTGLIQVARRSDGADAPLSLLDASNVSLENVAALAEELRTRTLAGARVILAIPSPLEVPAALKLLQAADVAVLCVRRGVSTMTECRQTTELIPRSRWAGSVLMDPERRNMFVG